VLDKAHYSAFQSTLNSAIVSYRIVRTLCNLEVHDSLCWISVER